MYVLLPFYHVYEELNSHFLKKHVTTKRIASDMNYERLAL